MPQAIEPRSESLDELNFAEGQRIDDTVASRTAGTERLRLLWNARKRLKRATTAGLVVGVLVAFLLPAKYESTAQLMPPDTQSASGAAMLAAISARTGGAIEGVSSDLLGLKSSGALFIGILSSRTVQQRLVNRFDLRKVYRRRLEEDARRDLAENTKAWEDRHSGIIAIAVTDRDRQRSTAIAQAYVDELNRLVAELSTSAAHRERVFLEQRLMAVKQNLDQASEEFSQFSSKNSAIDIKEQGRAMIDVAATVAGQLIAAESELSGLKQIYNPNNVRVRSVEARISELRRRLAELGGNGPAQPDTAENYSYPNLRKLPLLNVAYSDLYRRTKIQETVYETLTEQYELAKVQEAKETPSVKVLDAPSVPERRSSPPRLQIVFLCICLAISGMALSILLRARWEMVDTLHPAKVLAREVAEKFRTSRPWQLPNSFPLRAINRIVLTRWTGRSRPASHQAPQS